MHILLNILLSLLFVSPVDYPITLAGNFGEPRPNHFHAGIDIKTAQVEGKVVRSIGDGYVSRITVGLYGYGNAVFIQHPEGYTSVYCHLKCFEPYLEALVRKYQYQRRRAVTDIQFQPSEYPVAEGQIIALSGNTGSSVAPHLHLEMMRTSTGELVDPLDFIGKEVVDTTPPMAHGFMATPMEGEGVFMQQSGKQVFPFTSHHLDRKFSAWGKVGFGIWANDYMEGSFGNKYGIRKTQLLVDDKEVFSSDVSNIPYYFTRMVNSWGDYNHYLRSNVWYMRSYKEPGNRLYMLSAGENDGIVEFSEERDYHLKYILTDAFGNSTEYSFTVSARRSALPLQRRRNHFTTIYPNRHTVVDLGCASLTVREGIVAKEVELSPVVSAAAEGLSYAVTFSPLSLPLFDDARLSFKLRRKVADTSKLYVVNNWGGKRYIPAFYSDGMVSTYIRELGATYEVGYDEQPPVLSPVGESGWGSSGVITVGITDSQTGVGSYTATVDGQFILLEPVAKSEWFRCRLPDSPVRRNGKRRNIVITATDRVGNSRNYKTQIVY